MRGAENLILKYNQSAGQYKSWVQTLTQCGHRSKCSY